MSSQNNIVWLSENLVRAIHEAQIAEHGGFAGVRDSGLLESALAPQMVANYSDDAAPQLAALYAIGIIKNRPFIDGNKRVGAVVLETFLVLNGCELVANDAQLLRTVLSLAASEMREDHFTSWLAKNVRPTGNP